MGSVNRYNCATDHFHPLWQLFTEKITVIYLSFKAFTVFAVSDAIHKWDNAKFIPCEAEDSLIFAARTPSPTDQSLHLLVCCHQRA